MIAGRDYVTFSQSLDSKQGNSQTDARSPSLSPHYFLNDHGRLSTWISRR